MLLSEMSNFKLKSYGSLKALQILLHQFMCKLDNIKESLYGKHKNGCCTFFFFTTNLMKNKCNVSMETTDA